MAKEDQQDVREIASRVGTQGHGEMSYRVAKQDVLYRKLNVEWPNRIEEIIRSGQTGTNRT